jgi:hypothetical protein
MICDGGYAPTGNECFAGATKNRQRSAPFVKPLVAGGGPQRRFSLKGCILWRLSRFGFKHCLVSPQRRPT